MKKREKRNALTRTDGRSPFLSFSGKDDDDKLINEQHKTGSGEGRKGGRKEGRKGGLSAPFISEPFVRSLYKGFVRQSVTHSLRLNPQRRPSSPAIHRESRLREIALDIPPESSLPSH